MSKYKNTLLIFIALILFIYAAIISVVPKVFTSFFNVDKFEEQVYEATSLLTTLDSVQYKVKPNFTVVVTVKNLSLKYVDSQPLFDAKHIEFEASPTVFFGNDFNIKSMYMKNVVYADQILPSGENKIAFLPETFNSEVFGKKSISVSPSDLRIKNLKVTYVTPRTYKERNYREKTFYKDEVRDFLKSQVFSHVKVK